MLPEGFLFFLRNDVILPITGGAKKVEDGLSINSFRNVFFFVYFRELLKRERDRSG